jgi:hypothetical protein
MTVKEKYIKLYIKFLKKENLMNDKILYDYFIKYIKPNKYTVLPYAWFNHSIGVKLNLDLKFWEFIEDIFLDDMMELFASNQYTSEFDKFLLRKRIKKEMYRYGLTLFCRDTLHKSMAMVLLDFYKV